MNNNLSILVNSCDAYEDCWEPFFRLFTHYWPGCKYPIILNTETKIFQLPGLDIRVFNSGLIHGHTPQWGHRMRECLQNIESDVILYLQEDFFLNNYVDAALINEFSDYIRNMSWTHEFTMHIGLCPMSSHGPFHLTEHPLLWEVDRSAHYRFSLLPGLWNRKDLLSYLRPEDTGWSLEETSHIRARRTAKRILTVNRHEFTLAGRQIYPFYPSGIIRGKWLREAVEVLFAREHIDVDFSIRGFYSEISSTSTINSSNTFLRIKKKFERIKANFKNKINESIDRFRG